jgi:hypothetical protein
MLIVLGQKFWQGIGIFPYADISNNDIICAMIH